MLYVVRCLWTNQNPKSCLKRDQHLELPQTTNNQPLTVAHRRTEFYFVAENLVLWARSESIGYAMNSAASGSGMMEYRNDGMLGLMERDLFL